MKKNPSSEILPDADSKFWRIWNCVHVPEDPALSAKMANPVYLKNCRVAATYFVDRFLRPVDGHRAAFREMLLKMHTVLATGLTEVPGQPSTMKYSPQEKSPDRFRHEIGDDGKAEFQSVCDPFYRAFRESTAPMRVALSSPEAGVPLTTCEFSVRPAGPDSYDFDLPQVQPLWVQRVDFKQIEGRIHMYCDIADPEHAPDFLAAGEILMNKILELDPARVGSSGDKRQLFELVALYYQTMMICHPFLRQNNSLMMNQINCVLFLFAGKFLTHQLMLDMKAWSMPPEAFVKHVIQLLSYLPSIEIPEATAST